MMHRRTIVRLIIGCVAPLWSSLTWIAAAADELTLCFQQPSGIVVAVQTPPGCGALPGTWGELELGDGAADSGWTGASSGSLQTTHPTDSVIVGPPTSVSAKLTVNAAQDEPVLRARAGNRTAFFIGADGQTGVRTAQPRTALHVNAVSGEDPFRVDRFGVSDPQFLVTSTGSVIVGPPTGVSAKLTVNAAQDEPVLRARAGNRTAFFIGADGQTGVRTAQPQTALHVNAVSGEHPFRVDRFGVSGPQFLVTSTGNIGIGTPNPVASLHIEGRNDGTDLLVRDNTFARMRMVATDAQDNVTLSVQARGSQDVSRAEIGTISNHGMVLFTNASPRITISSSGAVCIGNC